MGNKKITMDSKEIKTYLDQGYIHLIVLFEIVGNPKEHVSLAMDQVLKSIGEDKRVKIISNDRGTVEDAGDGLWGTYCETELLVKDLLTLSWLSFNYLPASIEIKAPAKLIVKDKELTDFVGDLISQLHESNKRVVATSSVYMGMLRSVNALIRNAVLISLNQEEKTAAELAKKVGVQTKDLDPVLEAMIKEKTIEKKGTKYKALVKK
jgi:hypothetical protein